MRVCVCVWTTYQYPPVQWGVNCWTSNLFAVWSQPHISDELITKERCGKHSLNSTPKGFFWKSFLHLSSYVIVLSVSEILRETKQQKKKKKTKQKKKSLLFDIFIPIIIWKLSVFHNSQLAG